MDEITPPDSNYPPRFEPAPDNPNFRLLVRDEPEWLARPAPRGVDHLPEDVRFRKCQLRDHYIYSRKIRQFISCPACQVVMLEMFSETGFDESPLDRLAARSGVLNQNAGGGHRLAPPPECTCRKPDLQQPLRAFQQRAGGVITADEFYSKLIEFVGRPWPMGTHGLGEHEFLRLRADESQFQHWLALELCGPNPFRPVAFDPAWRTETTFGLAGKMYDDRDFRAMPILADALEEAGCDHTDILTHCRELGEHVRGCWVVDLVLGK